MKTFSVVLLAAFIVSSGCLNVLHQIRVTWILDEIIRFINLVKNELNFRASGYEEIYLQGKSQNYKYLSFSDGQIFIGKGANGYLAEEFNGFINKIGTTDEAGQLNICEEYKLRFNELLEKRKKTEKEKIQVNTALSLFGALTVLIFFL